MIYDYYQEMLKVFDADIFELKPEYDLYLLLDGPSNEFNELFTIRKKSEWEQLGFNILIDKSQGSFSYKSFSKNRFIFSFRYNLNHNNERVIEAIQTKKKIFLMPDTMVSFLKYGYKIEDFITLRTDLIHYVNASLSFSNSDFEKCLSEISQAIQINPYCDFYSLYFKTLLQLKRTDFFDEYLNYYKNNYGVIINDETLFKWLKILLKKDNGKEIIQLIENLRLEIKETIPEGEGIWFGTHQKFEKNVIKILEKAKHL